MSTEIYYFSGTGNSLHIAKELQKRIPSSSLIPIVKLLEKEVIQTSGKTVGFVFPVHALTIPIAVKKFIERTDFGSAEYLFAITTREGTIFRGFEKIDRLLRKKNKQLSSHFILNMYNNESRHEGYKVPTESDLLILEKAALEKLDFIQDVINNKRTSREEDCGYTIDFGRHPILNYLLEKLVLSSMAVSEYIGGVNYFYKDSRCSGCGICEKVCLSKKISLVDGKPIWHKKVFCYMCFACLNFCPQKSVQIKNIPGVKSYSKENGRYPHPYATIRDISAQKRL
jgi:ferredoxin